MSIPRGNGTQACAACKYQRRKCAPDCILAPYFPHDRQRQFLNAHKLFGVSNITKIIRNLRQPDKDEAMRTIIFQSDVRASDPVGGCYRIIRELQRQIDYCEAELEIVLHQLAIHRAQAHHQQTATLPDFTDSALNCDVINVDTLSSYNLMGYHQLQPQQEQQQHYVMQFNNHVPWACLQEKQSFVKECIDVKLPLDVAEERHHELNFEGEETLGKSEESILRDDKAILKEENESIQHVQDHDLKSAATLFTLTNCNC
ncbi:LOB domain-containing protein 22-like [Cornus florida]|uniref:LOB domain-containing protein 22-like n=1 Tax=Cornus florida TaxID=4283 RepID=UPI0028A0388E|nr:LOB domain-containing protein 22-like [Cornus florida]